MGSRLVVVVAGCWLGACVTPFSAFVDDVFPVVELRALPAIDDRHEAQQLIDEEVLRFEEVDGVVVARQFTRSRVRIHSARGQRHRGASVVFDRTFFSVEAFAARTTAPDGKRRDFADDDVVDVPSLGTYMLYSDQRRRSFVIPEQPRGAIVDVASVLRTASPETFAFTFHFAPFLPTLAARFVVEHPAGWDVETRIHKAPGSTWDGNANDDVVDGVRRRVWERGAAPAFQHAEWGPLYTELFDSVSVRLRRAETRAGVVVEGPKDIADLSRIEAALSADRARVTPALQKIVVDVLGPDPLKLTPRERAARLYGWTRDSIRYCAIEIGMGGFIPHPSDDVERLRYGDCKDKANLLKALLAAADVDSRLVTIYASMAPRAFGLPVIGGNFNHAILVVDLPEGPVFVDPTTRTVAFGDLPPVDEARTALPIDPRGADLVTTPSSSPETDRTTSVYRLALAPDGLLRGDFDVTLHGSFADDVRGDLLQAPADDRVKVIAKALSLESIRVSAPVTTDEAPPLEVTPLKIVGTVERRAPGGRMPTLFDASALLQFRVPALASDRPAVDVVLDVRQRHDDEVRVALPATARVRRLPPPSTLTAPHLRFSIAWSLEGQELVLRRSLTLPETRIAAADVPALRVALDAYARGMEARVLLEETGAP